MPPSDRLDRFSRTARELSGGPLGIIALFIVLVYGMAALVVGAGYIGGKTEHLTPLVWFLVWFPVLVLGIFTWLVAYHTEKLYPPTETPRYIPKLGTPSPAPEPATKKTRPKKPKAKRSPPTPKPETPLTEEPQPAARKTQPKQTKAKRMPPNPADEEGPK